MASDELAPAGARRSTRHRRPPFRPGSPGQWTGLQDPTTRPAGWFPIRLDLPELRLDETHDRPVDRRRRAGGVGRGRVHGRRRRHLPDRDRARRAGRAEHRQGHAPVVAARRRRARRDRRHPDGHEHRAAGRGRRAPERHAAASTTSCSRAATASAPPRRSPRPPGSRCSGCARAAPTGRPCVQRFFRLGEVVLELISTGRGHRGPDPLLRTRGRRRRHRRAARLLRRAPRGRQGRGPARPAHRDPPPQGPRPVGRRRLHVPGRGLGLTGPLVPSPLHARPRLHRCHRCAAGRDGAGLPRAPGLRGAVPGRRPARRPDLGDLLQPPRRGSAAPHPGRHQPRLADLGPERVPVLVHRRAVRGTAPHRDRDRHAGAATGQGPRPGRGRGRAARRTARPSARSGWSAHPRRSRRSTTRASPSSSTRSR